MSLAHGVSMEISKNQCAKGMCKKTYRTQNIVHCTGTCIYLLWVLEEGKLFTAFIIKAVRYGTSLYIISFLSPHS
jgi:hypothetical protein